MDLRAFINLIILVINMGSYNLYFYELLFGSWNTATSKGLYYAATSLVLLYLFIGDIMGKRSNLHVQLSLICKGAILVNFILFALILYGVTKHPILYLFLLNGSIFVLSVMILLSGVRHDLFKR